MTTTFINAGNAKYLGEVEGFNDLPSKCLFNKVLTGCGGTSVALQSDQLYVIAMPYTELIKNKMKWCEENNVNAVPIYYQSGFGEDDIRGAKKIMVTYDSLPKVVETLGSSVKDYKLLVDEYHILTKSGEFRYGAINSLLKIYQSFGDYVFMSATPIHRDYLPNAIQHLPEVRVKWDKVEAVTIDYSMIGQSHLYIAVANTIKKYLTGEHQGNAYFFLNSVESITDITAHLKKFGLSPEDIRIVCAENDKNRDLIDSKLGKKFSIGSTSDLPRKINFLTCKAFEGCDIYDENGRTYIVVDGSKPHTKYDVMTTIPQIIGRIRDSQTRNWVKLVYSPNLYISNITEEEFKATVMKNLKEAEENVKLYYSTTNERLKKHLLEAAQDDKYYVVNDTDIEVNDTTWKQEMSNFHAMHRTYFIRRDAEGNLDQEPKSKSVKINEIPHTLNKVASSEFLPDTLDQMQLAVIKPNFKELCNVFNEMVEKYGKGIIDSYYGLLPDEVERKLSIIKEFYPLIPEAFKYLGYEKIVALKYHQPHIKSMVLKHKNWSQPTKVMSLLRQRDYETGKKRSLENIKQDLQDIYDLLSIECTAKASDIKNFFDVKAAKVNENGERVHAYALIAPKLHLMKKYAEVAPVC